MGLIRFIANILWFIGGGLISFITWLALGLLLCLTIIGIPFGIQCLKLATLVLAPFGKEVVYGGKTGSFLMNILWLPLGLTLCLEQVALGLIYCITIIGIPAGLQAFKMAKLSLMPFGAEVRKKSVIKKEKAATAQDTTTTESPVTTEATPVQTTPTTETTTTQPQSVASQPVVEGNIPPQTTEPTATSTEPTEPTTNQEEKHSINPAIIVGIILCIIAVLGVTAFLVLSFLMNSKMESAPLKIQRIEPERELAPTPTVEDISQACAMRYNGTFTLIGTATAIDDITTVDSYFCQIGAENTGFLAYFASRDYLEVAKEEDALKNGGSTYTEETNDLVSSYVSSLTSSNILPTVEAPVPTDEGTQSIVNAVRDNVILETVGMDSDSIDSVIDILYDYK